MKIYYFVVIFVKEYNYKQQFHYLYGATVGETPDDCKNQVLYNPENDLFRLSKEGYIFQDWLCNEADLNWLKTSLTKIRLD
jgi:hypothetical protein